MYLVLTTLLLLYEAFQRSAQFAHHTDGIVVDAEEAVHLHRFEVRAQGAVVVTGDRYEVAVEDARIALGDLRSRLHEREVGVDAEELVEVGVRVACEHALVSLAGFHVPVVAQDGLNVTA